jgi:hypothetical protein
MRIGNGNRAFSTPENKTLEAIMSKEVHKWTYLGLVRGINQANNMTTGHVSAVKN